MALDDGVAGMVVVREKAEGVRGRDGARGVIASPSVLFSLEAFFEIKILTCKASNPSV